MRRALLVLLLALAAAGCGAAEETAVTPAATATPDAPRDIEPTVAARTARPDAATAARLDAGAVALVDLQGAIGIRPRTLEFAKGGRIEDVAWSSWTDEGAIGRGTMVGLVCDPNCAQGTTISEPATIVLSEPVACPPGRFFDRARIEVASSDPDAASTSWLAAPC